MATKKGVQVLSSPDKSVNTTDHSAITPEMSATLPSPPLSVSEDTGQPLSLNLGRVTSRPQLSCSRPTSSPLSTYLECGLCPSSRSDITDGRPSTSGTARARTSAKSDEKRRGADKSRERSKTKRATKSPESDRSADLKTIKEQLSTLMELVPVVAELKQAYDNHLNVEAEEAAPDNVSTCDASTCEMGETANEMSYFESIAGTQALEEYNLQNNLAKGVEKMLSEGLSKDTSAQLTQKYETPTNCARLAVLPCNPEVFKNASAKAKSRDSALQNTQKALAKGLSAVIYAYDDLLHSPDGDTVQVREKMADGIALLSHASHSLDMFRRQSFKGEIKDEYNTLCTTSYPAAGSLFGPNVNDKIKEVQESMRVARTTRRFQPYPTRRFPFLGQRQPWNSKGGGKGQSYPQRAPWQQQRSQSYPQRAPWQQQQKKSYPRRK